MSRLHEFHETLLRSMEASLAEGDPDGHFGVTFFLVLDDLEPAGTYEVATFHVPDSMLLKGRLMEFANGLAQVPQLVVACCIAAPVMASMLPPGATRDEVASIVVHDLPDARPALLALSHDGESTLQTVGRLRGGALTWYHGAEGGGSELNAAARHVMRIHGQRGKQ
jgi:hypothetical protein